MAKKREEKEKIKKLKQQGLCIYEGEIIPVMEAMKRGGHKGGNFEYLGRESGEKGKKYGEMGKEYGEMGKEYAEMAKEYWVMGKEYGVMVKKMESKARNLGYWVQMMGYQVENLGSCVLRSPSSWDR